MMKINWLRLFGLMLIFGPGFSGGAGEGPFPEAAVSGRCDFAGMPVFRHICISPGSAAPQCGICDDMCMAALGCGAPRTFAFRH